MVRNLFVCALLFLTVNVFSQFSISGKVTDTGNQALIGASIIIEGSQMGTTTDKNGVYNLKNLPAGVYTLNIVYLGYENYMQEVELNTNAKFDFVLKTSSIMAEEVLVVATRAGNKSVAHVNVSKEALNQRNLGQDLPYLLSLTPSMVVTSDAGAGVGYTNFRIRGTDASRINTTVNGIPMNDAESHGVWWVNMPDFVSSLDNVEVQRGVGTSTNGAGAFGATINMQTNSVQQDAYAEISSSAGSFNTFKNTVKAGTGLLADHFAVDMRLSNINSDGYVDRAASDLKSFFVSGGYYSQSTILKVNIFSGKEKTYQAWWGVPKVRLENDEEGMLRYKEHWLWSSSSERVNNVKYQELINSDSRTYNYYTYDNETDNYQQDHYQLFFSQKIGSFINFNIAGHYTYGRGYYEQFRMDDAFEDYGLPNVITPNIDTITTTDLVRQKWLDNDFYGATFSFNYKKSALDVVLGGAWNKYDGRHFGKLIWAQYLGNTPKDYEWYRSNSEKIDNTVYAKANYVFSPWISAYGDVQYRHIEYDIVGGDDDLRDITQNHTFDFFNPKVGVVVKPSDHHKIYVSFAIANREPTRSNFTDANPEGPIPTAEKLYDFEAGYTFTNQRFTAGANLYAMYYHDQLVLTGEINDVGSGIMVNVDRSYRQGIEIFGGVQIVKMIRWDANATFSKNKIEDFTEYVDNWDTWGQEAYSLGETDLAFAPNFLATSQVTIEPIQQFNIAFISQFVSEQFIDNTSSEDRMLDAYFINNLKLDYSFYLKGVKAIEFSLLVNNIFSEVYESNAWVYSYLLGDERYAMDGYFPQAGINFMGGVTLKF
jgi:iron complex outermembrane receptor protein